MPERIEETLLVFEPFTSGGMEYLRGDRLPVRHRWVRRIAREHPELFRMEYAPEDVDLAWLDSIEDDAEERYSAVLQASEAAQARAERALRDELAEQTRGQPELERRYRKQEADKKRAKEEALAERKRERIERDIELARGGF